MELKTLPLDIFVTYFSAYSAHAIELEGSVYPTVEHAYHCLRYKDQKIIDEIKAARSPIKAWEISQKYKSLQVPNFGEQKLSVMKKLFKAKLEQHADVRKSLIDSGDLQIVKHITTGPAVDSFWDDGEDGKGMNHVGKIWMELRTVL